MMTDLPGEAYAEALRIAERRLIRLGWKHSSKEIGETARDILSGLERPTAPSTTDSAAPRG